MAAAVAVYRPSTSATLCAVILDELEAPIVLAPLAGGPSTPALAAAVSEAGGFAFLAAGYLSADETAGRIRQTRALTDRPFGVNVFGRVPGPADSAGYAPYVDRLTEWAQRRGLEAGTPRYSDDQFDEKVELLASDPVAVVSFTFACPEQAIVARLQEAGAEVWITVTTPAEADHAARVGADALVVQGAEAGGHRGSFVDGADAPALGLLPLLQLIGAAEDIGLVASGGIATGAAVAAALCAGARAAQVGTGFMLCPEAGTGKAHRRALRSDRPTALTRAFTGRTARGIRNAFMAEHDAYAPYAYPEIHYLTAPLRQAGRASGDPDVVNLWAGQAYPLADEIPAADLVRRLHDDARRAVRNAAARVG